MTVWAAEEVATNGRASEKAGDWVNATHVQYEKIIDNIFSAVIIRITTNKGGKALSRIGSVGGLKTSRPVGRWKKYPVKGFIGRVG